MNTTPDLLTEELSVNPTVANHLNETAKWTRFLSVLIFIALALMLVALLVGSAYLIPTIEKAYPVFGSLGGMLLVVVGVILAVLGVLTWFLLRFSIHSIKALRLQQQTLLQSAFSALRIYLMISGVFTIIGLLSEIFNLITAL